MPGDEMAPLRTNVLALLLLERLLTIGPMTEPAAVIMLENRAPGRADEVISWARGAGMVRRIPALDDEPAMIAPTHAERRPIAA
jgi:hypothetical protein